MIDSEIKTVVNEVLDGITLWNELLLGMTEGPS